MAGPIVAGLLGGALSIFGGAARNAAIQRAADANFNNTLQSLGLQRDVAESNLLFQGDEINRQIGMELSNLLGEQRATKATEVAGTTERNIYGSTAMRTQGKVDMTADAVRASIIQSGESAMTNLQTNLTNTMYQYNQGVYAASQNRANMMSQKQGALELLAGGASSAFNFASGYRSMKGY